MPYSKTDVAALERLRDVHHAHLIRASWDDPKAALDRNHLARPYTGEITNAYAYAIKPASLGLAAIDVDYGSATFDFSTPICVASKTPGRQHIYVFVALSADAKKYEFATDTAFGEIIHQAKVNLWHPADFLEHYESTVPGVLVGWDELPAKWKWPRGVKAKVKAKLDELKATTAKRRNTLRDTALVVFSRVKADQYPGALAWQELRTAAAATGLDVEEVEKTLTDAEDAAEPWTGGTSKTLQWTDIVDDESLLYDLRSGQWTKDGRLFEDAGELDELLNIYSERLGKDTTSSRFHNEVLPRCRTRRSGDLFLNYLGNLPPWDTTKRLKHFWNRIGATTEGDSAAAQLARWAGPHVFDLAVTRAYQPGYFCKEMIILKGEQSLAKSSVLGMIFPDEFQMDWYASLGDIADFDPRRPVEQSGGAVFLELEECQGLSKRSILSVIKRYISLRNDKVRLAYDRTVGRRPRVFVLIGTTNSDTPLPVDAGTTRFVVIELVKPEEYDVDAVLATVAKDRDLLWAEALHRHAAKVPVRLPETLWALRETVNQKFMDHDERLTLHLRSLEGEDTWEPIARLIEHEDFGKGPWASRNYRETAISLGYEAKQLRNVWHLLIPNGNNKGFESVTPDTGFSM